ncbi:MAG: type I secretion C-terminal target domain-containing protein, partial [Bosea sp. (in: a-proteobacteria)]
ANVSSNFSVNLIGDADVPTADASGGNVAGASGLPLAITLAGVSTDTDTGLGRTASESIYYIVEMTGNTSGIRYAFTDSFGAIRGFDLGGGQWYLGPDDLAGLHIIAAANSLGQVGFKLTTVATENDGDQSTSSDNAQARFTVDFNVIGSNGGNAPLAPQITIGATTAAEDGTARLNVSVAAGIGDTSNPSIAVLIRNADLPAGASLIGAIFNPTNNTWIAPASVVNSAAGLQIKMPANFSGTLPAIPMTAVATNAALQSTSTSASITIDVTAVADGPAINATPATAIEDTPIALNLTVAPRDTNGTQFEVIDGLITIRIPATASLSAGTELSPGVWQLNSSQLAGLTVTPPSNFHGTLSVVVEATTREPSNNTTQFGSSTINLNVAARGDAPTLGGPSSFSGTEDTPILVAGLTAALSDADGSETMSVKIADLPTGAILSHGSNNGDGTWTVPVASLSALTITPPPNFSGTMTLRLVAYGLELSNGDFGTAEKTFTVNVAPDGDAVIIDPQSVSGTAGAMVKLNLQTTMLDTTGSTTGENPAELIEITFSSMPAGAELVGTGLIENLGGGQWRFTGTKAAADALMIDTSTTAGSNVISVTARSVDGADLGTATSSVQFTLTTTGTASAVASAGADIITGTTGADTINALAGNDRVDGGNGNDTLSGGTGADYLIGGSGDDIINGGSEGDIIIGGVGVDTMTLGTGADVLVWRAGDNGTSPDIVTDFSRTDGDILNLSELLPGYIEGTSVLSNFIRSVEAGGNTTIQIDTTGAANFTAPNASIVQLSGVTGLDLQWMKSAGQLIV